MEINERFKALREALGFSQTEFGKLLGLSRSGVGEIESGRRNVTDKHILLLTIKPVCEKNVSEIWLRTGEGEMFQPLSRREQIARFAGELMREPEDSFRLRLVDALSRLSVEEWEVLRKIAEEMAGGKS